MLSEAPVLSFLRNNLSKTRGMPQARTEERLEVVLCSFCHYYELFCQNLAETSDSRHLVLFVPHLTIVTMYFWTIYYFKLLEVYRVISFILSVHSFRYMIAEGDRLLSKDFD